MRKLPKLTSDRTCGEFKNRFMSERNKALLEAFEKGYRVSECGKYLNTPFSKLTQNTFIQGYPVFGIRVNGKKVNVM